MFSFSADGFKVALWQNQSILQLDFLKQLNTLVLLKIKAQKHRADVALDTY
jgi:hypothetical protein